MWKLFVLQNACANIDSAPAAPSPSLPRAFRQASQAYE
jgi:hypothetical protein